MPKAPLLGSDRTGRRGRLLAACLVLSTLKYLSDVFGGYSRYFPLACHSQRREIKRLNSYQYFSLRALLSKVDRHRYLHTTEQAPSVISEMPCHEWAHGWL